MFTTAYLNTAATVLDSYKGSEPFHNYIRKYFAANKKFGSRDRKQITQLCYSFFRLGKALQDVSVEEKLLIALFLCNPSNPILEQKKPEWSLLANNDIEDKIKFIEGQYNFKIEDIFPFKENLSALIDYNSFCTSFLIQPFLYLRIRPEKETIVQQRLEKAGLTYQIINPTCIALPNTSKADEVLQFDAEVVVQDLNSQQVLQPLLERKNELKIKTVWDCCAASGGKSLLLIDNFPPVTLTVSDVRESILVNLENRFKRAGVKNYRRLVLDVASNTFKFNHSFDLIICDAPCSGSGTWSRTPEQLYFFDKEKITYYSTLQKKIVSNAVKCLNKNGSLLYITCSVFMEENEEVVEYIQQEHSLQLQSMTYFKGYNSKADTLFTALFSKL